MADSLQLLISIMTKVCQTGDSTALARAPKIFPVSHSRKLRVFKQSHCFLRRAKPLLLIKDVDKTNTTKH